MVNLNEIVAYCDARVRCKEIRDFKGSENGLQVANNGAVTKIGAAVDAGLIPFKKAAEAGIDYLIVHHGMYWVPPIPLTGHNYDKVKVLMDHNIALYGSHLPLDGHPEIGNNALLAQELGLEQDRWAFEYEKHPIGLIASNPFSREELGSKLDALFPQVNKIEFGSSQPEKVAVITGSGASVVESLKSEGVDTLITGELRQHHYNVAQEMGLNLYLCGHYATETFGVKALAAEVAEKFSLDWTFIGTDCPL